MKAQTEKGHDGVLAAASIGAGAVALLVYLRLAPLAPFQGNPALTVAVCAATVLGGIAVITQPKWVFLGFVFASMAFSNELELGRLELGFMKLYTQDVVFAFNMVLIGARASVGIFPLRPIQFNKLIGLHILLGVYGLVVGLVISKHEIDNALGDFRRSFFYFLNFFVAQLICDNYGDVRKLRRVLLAGGIAILIKGFMQVAMGEFYARRYGDAAHILSHFELTFLSFLTFHALASVLFDNSGKRTIWWPLLIGSIVITILGNYRAAWVGMVGGLLFVFFYLPQRRKVTLAVVALASALFIALAVFAMWEVEISVGGPGGAATTIGEEVAAKAAIGKTAEDINVIWRFQSYANAINIWLERPIMGIGLGALLEFDAITSSGEYMTTRGGRVHNSFLWMLMSLGALGFAIFLYIQYRYLGMVQQYLKVSDDAEGRRTVLACGAFYVSFMIATAFEIFLESAMPITVLSTSMALAVLTIYYTSRQAEAGVVSEAR